MKFATYSENCKNMAGRIAHGAVWPDDKDCPDYDWWTKTSAMRYIRDAKKSPRSGPAGALQYKTAYHLADYLK